MGTGVGSQRWTIKIIASFMNSNTYKMVENTPWPGPALTDPGSQEHINPGVHCVRHGAYRMETCTAIRTGKTNTCRIHSSTQALRFETCYV